ncbi:cobalt transporter [Leptospira hartskeerlii]|uniref:Cobalt transporter n=1 Tax=Leptospira hartskeerlii TaxID=2023177 RepID=A0A2M9XFN8_9LEPT|nr:CbtB domain-containing protein [Leptospira hartskeerlii]PJZ26392.1 cobalt transporter [Leptospira hartskeerlii]PJZ34477.1 cobalt transporter [Leptospira hartskeerlii]
MRSISVSKDFSGARLWLRTSVLVLVGFLAFSTIYAVGLEPMVYLHDTFHDIRHSTGFPCH